MPAGTRSSVKLGPLCDQLRRFERNTLVQQESPAFNLERALGLLRHRLPLVALCVVVLGGAAFGFSKHQTKKYTASVSLDFEASPFDQQIAGLPTSTPTNSTTLQALQASAVERSKSAQAAIKTASAIGHGLTPAKVTESLEIGAQGESPIVVISAKTTSPALSAAIANTYAKQIASEQQAANVKGYKAALAIVRKQIAALSPAQRVGADGLNLQNRAQTLSLLSELKVGDVKVTAEALPPSGPSSPRTSRNTMLGAFVGLLIGLGIALALERIDRRIRAPEDLEAAYRLPLLGAVPRSAALARPPAHNGATAPAESEQFNLIRARLRYFNVDRDLHTMMVASAEAGEGKSLVARNLAQAAARSGAKALLVEADMRQPTLADHLELQAGSGLAETLIGATPLEQARRTVELEPVGEQTTRTLDVLTAGGVLPPNPEELLESRAMDALLARVGSEYDLVVLDTPPLTAVSDAFALLGKVDGVVLVGRIGASKRNAAERLHHVLSSSGAPLLGVVANCSRSTGANVYGYYGGGTPASVQTPSANGASSRMPVAAVAED
jgi:capsular exopolysaccharide synthesis family protein